MWQRESAASGEKQLNQKEEHDVMPYSEMISEIIFFVVLIGLSVYAIADAAHIGAAIAREPLGPSFLPRFLAGGIIVLSMPMLFRTVLRLVVGKTKVSSPEFFSAITAPNRDGAKIGDNGRIGKLTSNQNYLFFSTLAISAVYIAALQYRVLWFPLSTMAFLFVLGSVIMAKEGMGDVRKQVASLIIVSIILSAILEVMFRHGLGLRLP